jgi:hypothetical protein
LGRSDVDLRIEEVQQVGDVQPEDRTGQNALEIRPADRHGVSVTGAPR